MPVAHLSELQIAYLSGLIDGEGSLECQKQMGRGSATPRFALRLSFCFGSSEPLATISGWLGLTPKCYPPVDEKRSPRWRLHIPKGIAVPLLVRCHPHLILKRKQCELALRIEAIRAEHSPPRKHVGSAKLQRMPMRAVSEMDGLLWQLRTLKSDKRGQYARVNVLC